jgi:hypothetical protein
MFQVDHSTVESRYAKRTAKFDIELSAKKCRMPYQFNNPMVSRDDQDRVVIDNSAYIDDAIEIFTSATSAMRGFTDEERAANELAREIIIQNFRARAYRIHKFSEEPSALTVPVFKHTDADFATLKQTFDMNAIVLDSVRTTELLRLEKEKNDAAKKIEEDTETDQAATQST